ncbi:hypothetical protein BU23DRAFT_598895 [Bimuria novae-zelandiae CBS 107.79]|uniref:Zn(2)-C6 fungal-type domain-containing protein n=1 Tax=Bimuria novae-zelandiae CBS 107.79 TaxID=1447943 RepID=A0A6A5VEN0_9PLEO|nr:hypothetical protein BU23DRAFT_598895 [Bimuria novae-zelandiae CBS 107.79]
MAQSIKHERWHDPRLGRNSDYKSSTCERTESPSTRLPQYPRNPIQTQTAGQIQPFEIEVSESFIKSRHFHEAATFQFALQSCKMFATFRHNQGKDSLDAVRQSNDPPVLKGAHFDACRKCREKKLRCTGEKSGCDRCLANEWQCTYPGRRRSRQNSVATTHKRKPSNVTAMKDQVSNRSRAHPQTHANSQPVTPPTYLDDSASTTTNEMTMFDENSWQLEAMRLPLSPKDGSEQLFDLQPVSSWSMLEDHNSELPDQSSIQQNAADELAMNLDFEVDEFLSLPDLPPSQNQSLEISPTDMSSEVDSTIQHAMYSSTLLVPISDHTQLSPPTQTQPKNQSSRGKSIFTDHHCTEEALRVLESSMAGPKAHTAVEDLLRFLANAKSNTRSLVKLAKCNMCSDYSQFLVLMVININALLDATENARKLLSEGDISTDTWAWNRYGVDSAEEFRCMYSPLFLPIVGALRTVIGEISQVCLTQNLQPQLENLEHGRKRLETLEVGLQSML